jgi:hypothetical protein
MHVIGHRGARASRLVASPARAAPAVRAGSRGAGKADSRTAAPPRCWNTGSGALTTHLM